MEPLLARQEANGTWSASLACFGSSDCPVYPTALTLACLEFSFADELGNVKATQKVTGLSYGYNPDLGVERRTPGADTIMVMDYVLSIFRKDDPKGHIAPRHGGRANALMGDGAVRALRPEEITDGMWTLEPDD